MNMKKEEVINNAEELHYKDSIKDEINLKHTCEVNTKNTRRCSHRMVRCYFCAGLALVIASGLVCIPFIFILLLERDPLTYDDIIISNDTSDGNVINDDEPDTIYKINATYQFEGNYVKLPSESEIEGNGDIFAWLTTLITSIGREACAGSFEHLDLALVYESSYCEEMGGKEAAEREIQLIVARVSKKFEEQGICTKVRVSHLEGWCGKEIDPYVHGVNIMESGCNGYGLLDEFKDIWTEDRQHIDRSAAILISGTQIDDPNTGCSFTNSLCDIDNAYAVTSLMISNDLNEKVNLVAQELGHIAGGSRNDLKLNMCAFPIVRDLMCPNAFESSYTYWGDATAKSISKHVSECL